MNFLAHFQLAWPDEQLVLGGLEGDYHKGPVSDELAPGLAQGIVLHRAIDAFTDSHPRIEALRREFPTSLRRYAGILIDLSFDHYLSQYWSHYSELSLQDFNQRVYRILEQQQTILSPAARHMAGRLREYDVLGIYQHWDSVPASAARVGERFRRENPLLDAAPALGALRSQLEQAFVDFYPDLIRFSQQHQAGLPD